MSVRSICGLSRRSGSGRRVAAWSALAFAAATTVAAAPAASAAVAPTVVPGERDHAVSISGVMDITDDEVFSDERATVPFNATVVVGPNLGTTTYVAKGCAGGEVRVEVTVVVVHKPTVLAEIRPTIRLFEGTSCSSNDLDGSLTPARFTLANNGVATLTQTVRNTAEGGDKATVTLTVRNTSI